MIIFCRRHNKAHCQVEKFHVLQKVIERRETKRTRAVIELKNVRKIKRTQKYEETCCILFSFSESQATTSLCVSRKTEKRFRLYLFIFSFVFIGTHG